MSPQVGSITVPKSCGDIAVQLCPVKPLSYGPFRTNEQVLPLPIWATVVHPNSRDGSMLIFPSPSALGRGTGRAGAAVERRRRPRAAAQGSAQTRERRVPRRRVLRPDPQVRVDRRTAGRPRVPTHAGGDHGGFQGDRRGHDRRDGRAVPAGAVDRGGDPDPAEPVLDGCAIAVVSGRTSRAGGRPKTHAQAVETDQQRGGPSFRRFAVRPQQRFVPSRGGPG
jgi:hypothetical protein